MLGYGQMFRTGNGLKFSNKEKKKERIGEKERQASEKRKGSIYRLGRKISPREPPF